MGSGGIPQELVVVVEGRDGMDDGMVGVVVVGMTIHSHRGKPLC